MAIPESVRSSTTDHLVDLGKFDDRISAEITKILLLAESQIVERLRVIDPASPQALTHRTARLARLLEQVRGTLTTTYDDVVVMMHTGLGGVAAFEIRFANEDLQDLMRPLTNLVDVNTTTVSPALLRRIAEETLIDLGEDSGAAVVEEWFRAQQSSVQAGITTQLQQGILHGEGIEEMVRRISGGGAHAGVMPISRNWAETLVRTSVTAITSDVDTRLFEANGGDDGPLKGVYQVTFFDDRTTQICTVYGGKAWLYPDYTPSGHSLPYNGGTPRHPNCRSLMNPWVKSWEEIGLGPDEVNDDLKRALDGELPEGLDGEEWLKDQPLDTQQAILGKEKARLLREGLMDFDDLVDDRGRARTLAEVRKST